MALLLVGIDEAGYGPTLGPLCVASCTLRVEPWAEGYPAPDLWDRLSDCVSRRPNDKRGRIAIEDSKKLKLPNDSTRSHPLKHLERGVLTFLASAGHRPRTDAELFARLGATLGSEPWYAGADIALPLGSTAAQLDIAANALAAGLRSVPSAVGEGDTSGSGATPGGVSLVDLRCRVVCESEFNDAVRRWGTKAATTGLAIREHLRHAWTQHARIDGDLAPALRVVCDRQGGRIEYAESLARWVPGSIVKPLEETPARSRYELVTSPDAGVNADGPRRMIVSFQPEAETACMAVALASMTAKLVRELAMARFNRYWQGLLPELKPTAGYALDARRWLSDARPVLNAARRAAITRIA